MSHLLTPEHLQLLSKRHLEAATLPAEHVSDNEEEPSASHLARAARYELRRREGQVPVRDRYTSVPRRQATR